MSVRPATAAPAVPARGPGPAAGAKQSLQGLLESAELASDSAFVSIAPSAGALDTPVSAGTPGAASSTGSNPWAARDRPATSAGGLAGIPEHTDSPSSSSYVQMFRWVPRFMRIPPVLPATEPTFSNRRTSRSGPPRPPTAEEVEAMAQREYEELQREMRADLGSDLELDVDPSAGSRHQREQQAADLPGGLRDPAAGSRRSYAGLHHERRRSQEGLPVGRVANAGASLEAWAQAEPEHSSLSVSSDASRVLEEVASGAAAAVPAAGDESGQLDQSQMTFGDHTAWDEESISRMSLLSAPKSPPRAKTSGPAPTNQLVKTLFGQHQQQHGKGKAAAAPSAAHSPQFSEAEAMMLEELELEIKRLQDERAHVDRVRQEVERERQRAGLGRAEFEREMESRRKEFEAERAEELRKLQRDRRVLEKQAKALLQLPTKKERSEVEALQAEMEAERKEWRAKEARHRLTVDRLRRQIVELQQRNAELRDEVQWHEKRALEQQQEWGARDEAKSKTVARGGSAASTPRQASSGPAAARPPTGGGSRPNSTGRSRPAPTYSSKESKASAGPSRSLAGSGGARGRGTSVGSGGKVAMHANHEPVSTRRPFSDREVEEEDDEEPWANEEEETGSATGLGDWPARKQPPTEKDEEDEDDGANLSSAHNGRGPEAGWGEEDPTLVSTDQDFWFRTLGRNSAVESESEAEAGYRSGGLGIGLGMAASPSGLDLPVAPSDSAAALSSRSKDSDIRPGLGASRGPYRIAGVEPTSVQAADRSRSSFASSSLAAAGGTGLSTSSTSLPSAAPSLVVQTNRQADGKVELVYSDGRRHVTFPNGTRKEVLPDGRAVIQFVNGDIKKSDPNQPQGTLVEYFYKEVDTWHVTLPDGLEVFFFPSGQVEAHHKDGSKEIRFPDGVCRTILADGVEVDLKASAMPAYLRGKPLSKAWA